MSTGSSITQDMIHGSPRNLLALGPGVEPIDLVNRTPCSIDGGCVVPFNAALPFGGIVDGIGQEKGRWLASTLIRGFMPLRVKKFSRKATLGAKVFVSQTNPSVFTFSGGAEIGVVAHIENMETGAVIVSFSLPHLPRP